MLGTLGAHVVPSGDGVGAGVAVDLEAVAYGVSRLDDVATVNPHKAPELRAALGKAWADARAICASLTREKGRAQNTHKRLRAIALKSSDAGSADLRAAEADTDQGVIDAADRIVDIDAVLVWLSDKAAAFRAGYYDVARAAGEVPSPPSAPMHARKREPEPPEEPQEPVMRQVPHLPPPAPDAPETRTRREPPIK